jgi:wyosine [tRNA(Phe)-imidazoG37] synthetase (radical SAM superfamily)
MNHIRDLCDGIVYGPLDSRRFGVSLGINLSGAGKYCSFNCPYCFRGFNNGRPSHAAFWAGLPTGTEIVRRVKLWLAANNERHIDDWTFAGNAEPTTHPDFYYIVDSLVTLRNEKFPHVKISALTNGMGLLPRLNQNWKLVRNALRHLNRPSLKLDSGNPSTWLRLARPDCGVTLDEWLCGSQSLSPKILQTMFVQGRIDNTTTAELLTLAALYRRLRPVRVDLMTLNKPPADSALHPVPEERMLEIESFLREHCDVPVAACCHYEISNRHAASAMLA